MVVRSIVIPLDEWSANSKDKECLPLRTQKIGTTTLVGDEKLSKVTTIPCKG